MPVPTLAQIKRDVEAFLVSRGGQADTSEVHSFLAQKWQLSPFELSLRDRKGGIHYHKQIDGAIAQLVKAKIVTHPTRGKCRLLGAPPPPNAPHNIAKQIKPATGLHEQMQAKLEEIGRILGKFAQKEFQARPFICDTVWKATAQLPPTQVFEVQDKGNLDSALVKLKHASDIWPCQLFLVVTGEKDREKAQELLAEPFAGAFHEIANKTTILSPEDIEALYKVLSQYKDIIGKWR